MRISLCLILIGLLAASCSQKTSVRVSHTIDSLTIDSLQTELRRLTVENFGYKNTCMETTTDYNPRVALARDFAFDREAAVWHAKAAVFEYSRKSPGPTDGHSKLGDHDFSRPYALFSVHSIGCDAEALRVIYASFASSVGRDTSFFEVLMKLTKDDFLTTLGVGGSTVRPESTRVEIANAQGIDYWHCGD